MEIIPSKIQVKSLTHNDIVNLLCTAITDGSQYLYLRNPRRHYETYCKVDPEDTLEDRCAKVLLSGGKIRITDYDADGVGYAGNDVPFKVGGDDEVTYTVGLDNILSGLENATNGDFIPSGGDDAEERRTLREAFDELAKGGDGCLDYTAADMLMQVILFGEVIYG